MKEKIFYTKPSITELEIKYATDAATNGWGEKCYDFIIRFENAFRDYLGVNYAIATSSCTGALHMGLAALDIGPGDEIILADTNWIATAAPIVHLGAKPVFVDILSDTWCINPRKVEEAITPNTKAIIVTHLYGNLCEMEQLLNIGEKHNLPVIEDAAEALGSLYHGRQAGSLGKFGTFSFHGSKTITTGEGGMFVTNDSVLFEKVLTLSNHGRRRGQTKQFWAEVIGFKYKMTNLQAAIGCAQLERSEELIERKREILNFYRLKLERPGLIDLNPIQENTQSGAWMPNVVFHPSLNINLEKIYQALKDNGVDARPFFHPLSSTSLFGLPRFENFVAYDISRRSINLPSYHEIQNSELEHISELIMHLL